MDQRYILSHDMGTSGDKAVLITVHGEIAEEIHCPYPMYHPEPTWAEQEPDDWWNAICTTTRQVLKKAHVRSDQIAGMTFSSQTQTIIPVSKKGKPLRRSIAWLDGRSADIMRAKLWTQPRLMGYHIGRLIRFLAITGGCPGHTGKDQVGKILWIKEHQRDIFDRTYKFIDAKDYIIFKLTGKFITSVDLAYIWWLMDSRRRRNQWHSGLCRLAGITPDKLCEIRASADIVGQVTQEAAKECGLNPGTPIINGAGDLSAAAVGSGALEEGKFHTSVGTSGWVAAHVSKRKIDIPHYTGCIGSARPDKYYLGMAHQETAGVCLEWLKNHVLYHEELLKKEKKVAEIYQIMDELAERAGPGAEGMLFTPWMYGERCPLDDDHVRAGLYNVGLNHNREHIIRAVFEGIAFNTRWAMETLENLYHSCDELNIVGGGAKSDIWCQIIADITNRPINRVSSPHHASAKGIALLASMSLGFIDSFEEIPRYIKIDRTFKPNPDNRSLYDQLFIEFKNLYKQNKKWFKRMNGAVT